MRRVSASSACTYTYIISLYITAIGNTHLNILQRHILPFIRTVYNITSQRPLNPLNQALFPSPPYTALSTVST